MKMYDDVCDMIWWDGAIPCCHCAECVIEYVWCATVSNERSVIADFGGSMIMICIRRFLDMRNDL